MVKISRAAKNVIRRDRKLIFTTTREIFPFVADRASGDYAYDTSGNRFIDFTSFISVYTLGDNANAEIRNAIKAQVDRLMHPAFLDFHAELPVRFAEKLVKMFPKGFGRVFFSNSGTEANEDAIKLARLFTKKTYFISFYGGFHGRSMGSLSLTAAKVAQRKGFGPFIDVIHAPYAYPYRCPFGTQDPSDCASACLSFIEDNIFRRVASPDEIAAIFFEPVQGEGGYVVPPKEFVTGLAKLARETGILLVDDEVQSGYMRTGKFLALDNFGVSADICTMAKALGGGMPIGATIARRSLGDTPPGSHAGTFGGNLVAVAAANASLDYVIRHKRGLEADVRKKSTIIMKRLEELKENYELVGDVRGLGLMIGMELVKSKKTKEYAVKERDRILMSCFNNGLLLLPAGTSAIRIIPPITISLENLEKGLNILESGIKSASE